VSSPLWNGERGRTMAADAPSPMLAAALSYAEKFGWKIFPARMEDGKKWSFLSAEFAPGGENWGMTNDPQQLAVNFNNRRWLHKCGVGIPTGAVNRIFIVEADTKKGHDVDGIESLRNLEARHTPFPETLMAESPSGSQHHYFNNPKNVTIKNSTSEIAPGVDVRGEGGMVVAPPSVRGDGAYRWLNEGTPIADAPKWLIELVRRDDAEAPRTVVNCGAVPAHLLGIGGVGKSTNPRDGYSREAEAARIAAAMEVIPNPDLGWEEWNKRGMAVFSASAGSEAGFKAFLGVDGRSPWVRRAKDIIASHLSDLGGDDVVSAAERSIVRQASCLTVELEKLETKFALAGEASSADLDLYIRASGNLRRSDWNGGPRTSVSWCAPPRPVERRCEPNSRRSREGNPAPPGPRSPSETIE
jgi:bifunctional DNA primase/polymerase-like protein